MKHIHVIRVLAVCAGYTGLMVGALSPTESAISAQKAVNQKDPNTLHRAQFGYSSFHNPRTIQDAWGSYGSSEDSGVQVTGVFQRTYGGKDFSRYLWPVDKTEVTLSEFGQGDINPGWLNLSGPARKANNGLTIGGYESSVSMKPYRRYVGALLHAAWQVSKNWTVKLYTGVMHTAAGVHTTETGGGNGTYKEISNFAQAMMNQNTEEYDGFMKYGRMVEKATRTGLDDVRVEFVYAMPWEHTVFDECVHHAGISVKLPCSKAPDAQYFLQPRVGSNHFGLGGVYNCELAWDEWSAVIDAQALYQFGAKEMRSFDLQGNGPWSRYLKVTKPTANIGDDMSAINIFTRQATVTPRMSGSLGVRGAWQPDEQHKVSMGYRCFIRLKEKISSVQAIEPGYGIRNVDRQVPAGLRGENMRYARIYEGGKPAYYQAKETKFVEIMTQDLDLRSAESPAWVSSLADVTYAYKHDTGLGLQVGAQVEVAHVVAFPSWAAFMAVGYEF